VTIRTILHGGLGNQLFQLFYAELLAKSLDDRRLTLVTTCLGSYAVGRDMELEPLLSNDEIAIAVTQQITVLERLRLPKLVRRVAGREVVLRLGGGHMLVDGYFQAPQAYARFGGVAVTERLAQWRLLLSQQERIVGPFREHLTHIRLTDFVTAGQDPEVLAAPIVERVPDNGYMITDDERTIGALIARRPEAGRPTLISTVGMSSWAVLQTMSEFREIDTNGSSLACWAASLTGARLSSTNPQHVEFARYGQAGADV